jgi:hypothetical protein
MTKLKNYLYKTSIDSFKYRIELRLVDVKDERLLDCVIETRTAKSTGELIEEKEFKQSALKIKFDHYEVKFAINQILNVNYLVILINSKMLESRYLEGINNKNIELIYNKIISCNVINISFEDFLSLGNISDIDIKKDFTLTKEDFKLVISDLYKKSRPNKKKNYGVNKFTKDDNLGIEWNDRKKATTRNPFLKLYHKEVEVANGTNKEYFEHYINTNEVKDVVRCEATAKGLKELKLAGIESSRLIDVLKASDKFETIIYNAIDLNIEPPLKPQRSKSPLSPLETYIFAHITNMIKNQNFTFEYALEFTLEHFNNKVAKSRAKKTITQVYESKIQGNISEVRQRRLSNFYHQFGWIKNTSI